MPMRRSRSLRLDHFSLKNFSSAAIFGLIFAAVFLAHWPLLRLPYYWDEAGYYIPAAYDFFRTGSLIPFSTLSNAHPPIPSVYLAASWKLFGFFPFVTRTAMCLIAALALMAVWRIGLITSNRRSIALATLALTAIYPIFFAQSSLAHADLFAAAATLWALVFFLDDQRIWPCLLCFSLAVLSKETAIITPLALAAWEAWLAIQNRSFKDGRAAALLTAPILPLALWYAYHWRHTGFIFGNPEFLSYNATTTLTPLRIVLALWHRTNQVTLHMNLFVPVLLALACLLLDPYTENGAPRSSISREHRTIFFVVILANVVAFSVLGGALLTRYMLPLYPLVILLCVQTFRARLKQWTWFVAFSAIAFIAALFINPPYRFAPEDNLSYSRLIRLHEDAISQIISRYPYATVLTAWPASDEMTKPELGYVTHPVAVTAIDDFSFGQIERAAQLPGNYNVALIFSTKYVPAFSLDLSRGNEKMDARFFGFHNDLDPEIIARILGGRLVWREQRSGQWAALLHFSHPQEALLGFR